MTILCEGYEQHGEEGILVRGGTSISVRDVLKLFLQSSVGIPTRLARATEVAECAAPRPAFPEFQIHRECNGFSWCGGPHRMLDGSFMLSCSAYFAER